MFSAGILDALRKIELIWFLCLHIRVSFAGVGLQRALPPQNECRPGSGRGDHTGPAAEEEHTGDGLGKVLETRV